MGTKVLITGGAGFIGSHVADELLQHGYDVRVFDSLSPQIHGSCTVRPEHLNLDAELIVGDLRDAESVALALEGAELVIHLAASVGVGQSMYEIAQYSSVNGAGTGVLLEALAKKPVAKLVLASCMSVYGEGLYQTVSGRVVNNAERSLEHLKKHQWELQTAYGDPLFPIPTPETKTPTLPSVYAISKYNQERLCLAVGKTYEIPTVALRVFNVYGPRQSLYNPYAGVLAIFAARLLNNKPPVIYEDGGQMRDFVSVHDVAQSFRLALETSAANGQVINIGSGIGRTVLEAAENLVDAVNLSEITPEVEGKCRLGDIRHCFADITLARELLGYEPQVPFEDGLLELAEWVDGRSIVDRTPEAQEELAVRGLTL
jgi:dTDP-L-rhamnose 4-epimerase